MKETILFVILVIVIIIAIFEMIIIHLHFDKIHENDNYINAIERDRNYLQLENDILKRLNTIQQTLLERRK